MLSKDVNFCFENKSPFPVTLRWNSGVNSNTGEGTLTKGQTVCAEGGEPEAILTTWDSLVTVITAANAPLVYPLVAFHSSKKEKLYETNFFAQGESVTSYFKGHWFMTTRTSDDDWIQFTVAIRE